ncbi:MAG: hypothetical protein LBU36_01355 [Clostridiales bacterium]|nr:hypothetical protein [Clostridiales bacterium]
MEDLSKQLQAYGIIPASCVKSRGAHRVEYRAGGRTLSAILRKETAGEEALGLAHEAKERLAQAGFTVDRCVLTAAGKPFARIDGDIYALTEYISHKEADFSDAEIFLRVVGETAAMHEALKGLRRGEPEESPVRRLERGMDSLRKVKSRLNIEKRLSDIDVMFLKNYGYYRERGEAAIKSLKESGLPRFLRRAAEEGQLRHNSLKEENILINGREVCFANFSNISLGYGLFDLEDLIRRHMKALPQAPAPFRGVIEEYGRRSRVEDGEVVVLKALLAYPSRFVKICGQYYGKKHAFIPAGIFSRMEREVSAIEAREKYLEG